MSPAFNASVMTKPEIDTACVVRGIGPLARAYDGMMIVKAKVTSRGQLNYFRVVKGPGKWTDEVLWKIAQCQAKPATIDGKPISVDYVLNLRFKRLD